MIEFIRKISYSFFNMFPHNLRNIGVIKEVKQEFELLVLIVEYDLFSDRKIKEVGGVSYECGKSSLDTVKNFCKEYKVDFISLTTTDDLNRIENVNAVNCEFFVKNDGTDISAIKNVVDILSKYQDVIFVNSSCAYDDAVNFRFLLERSTNNKPCIIGFNGNSRISPRPLIFFRKYPHIITNIFRARSKEILEVLNSEKKHLSFLSKRRFGCKYFAIRNFETLLSVWVLNKGGDLFLFSNNNFFSYKENPFAWPRRDTRLKRFAKNRLL